MTKDGSAIPGRKGWVRFGEGQLKDSEYIKFIKEQKQKRDALKAKAKKEVKDKEKVTEKKQRDEIRTEKRIQREHKALIEKAQRKIEEHDLYLAELDITNIPAKDVLAVIERTARIENKILAGYGLMGVALAEEMSRDALSAFLKKYYGAKSFTAYKKNLLAQHEEVEIGGIKQQREIRHYIRVPFESFKDRLEARVDPIVSTEDKNYGGRWYPIAEPGQRFSKNILIVPDRTLQPVKRTRVAAHSFLTAGSWAKGNKLLAASCKLAEKVEDKYITVEGGVIISQKFAKKQDLRIGDKVLGINGLKGIVSQIRKQSYDIIINKNQIWGAKMSRLCGGAVFDIYNNKIQLFYQIDHKIKVNIPAGSERKTRFSPDLVPFLAYYLNSEEIGELQADNKKRFQDILYMLNLEFVNKNGYLTLLPKYSQPTEREGGKLEPFNQIYWGKGKWVEGLSHKQRDMGKAGMIFPFILENIWLPDWYVEENKFPEVTKKNGKVISIVKKDCYFVNQLRTKPGRLFLGYECAKLISTYMFAHIENSISHLIAITKDGRADEALLNKIDCEHADIKEGDWILVFRYPVVDRLNIQKMQVKFSDITRTTIGVNVESIRLMHGDFDGDPLYLLKIPQTPDFADAFHVGEKKYKAERKVILEEIAENDNLKLPKDEREVKIAHREAFYKTKVDEGDWQPRKLETRGKKLRETATGHLRTDEELIEEAQRIHENMNASGSKAETIGTLTKWMWMASTDITEQDIGCVASLEVIKDRADKESEAKYKKSLEILKGYKKKLQVIKNISGEKSITWQTRAFEKLISAGTFKKDTDPKSFPVLSKLKEAPLIKAGTPYAKFILSLCRRVK